MVKSHAVRLLALFSATLTWSLAPALAETVLLDFISASCGPCQQMRPVVQQLAAAGYHVRDVDIHREPQEAARFGVAQVPTFIVTVDGREAERTVGLTSFAQLQQMLSRGSSHASLSTVAAGGLPPSPSSSLSSPQTGRIVEIQPPASQAAPTAAVANRFFRSSCETARADRRFTG